ncbi:aldo/keto reductase [Methanococcus maripaludis]|uniref:Diketogulonate reductase-like aldo/keto reductase n=1 Tax=Methanococcus maripaludis TaxID=39152 RepID=A0A7J9PP43_METMI|nr:aldo/keto reductase [Methanococcus maripaludis]MBA2864387.1 diketogulonate reductase-like aldo/keto reductase [Methanococcus maripaludis]
MTCFGNLICNFYGKSLDNILQHCDVTPAVIQQETHIYHQNIELRKTFEKFGIVLQAWSPFGEGRGGIFQNPTLIEISKIYNKSVAQIILRFLLQNDIASIPKTVHRDRMIENLNIFDFSLNDEYMGAIEKLDQSKSLFNWFDER